MKAKILIITALIVLGVVIFFAGYYIGHLITSNDYEQMIKNVENELNPIFQQCHNNTQTLNNLNENYTCSLKTK